VRNAWQTLLDEVRERSRVTQVLLSGATVHAVEGDTLVLTIGSAALARQLAEERHVEKITDALRAMFGGTWRLRCEQADGGGQRQPAAPQRPEPPQRPSRRIEPPARGANGRGARAADEPPPPEPPDPEPHVPPPAGGQYLPPPAGGPGPAPADDEDAMLAEAATAPEHDAGGRRDPEEVALELLADTLGARKIDDGR